MSADIFAGQLTNADLLAELYDLEHDEVTDDLAFYREMAARHRGPALDLGCGSGRIFASLLAGGAKPIVGVDGSPALLRRAEARIAGDERLNQAMADGHLALIVGDVRQLGGLGRSERFRLVVAAGVLPHLDGPEEAMLMLGGVARLLAADGRLVLDDLGPGRLPTRDLPLSVDWRRTLRGREVVRRSQLMRREAPEGLRIAFSTMVDLGLADGTIARLPASHRLWYPYTEALLSLVREAGLAVELAYGSHDLDPLEEDSVRRILVIRATTG
jgi:SAM-dependent methyltransferase